MTKTDRTFLIIGALSLCISATLGAYGFHGLSDEAERESWAWAVQMQVYHSLALILLTILNRQIGPSKLMRWSCWIFIAGMLIFSGSIYVETITGNEALGEYAPMGGTAFMIGWALLALSVWLTPTGR